MQQFTDLLDSPFRRNFLVGRMDIDERDFFCDRRSSSVSRKVDAACKIALARVSSRFSLRSEASSSRSLSVMPARTPIWTSAVLTHVRNDSESTPSCRGTRLITPWSPGSSRQSSKTNLTARSFNSLGHRSSDELFAILNPLPRYGASTIPSPNQGLTFLRIQGGPRRRVPRPFTLLRLLRRINHNCPQTQMIL